jgi:hypothetical protein
MSENGIEFIDGLSVKAPHTNAPDFVKAKIDIKREQMLKWLMNRDDEWINIDVKISKSGKWYASVDNWKPDPAYQGSGAAGERDEIPF